MGRKNNTPQSLDLASLSQEELLALATEQAATIEEKNAEISSLNEVIEQLSQANANVPAAAGNQVQLDGKTYELLTPKFYMGRQLITAQTLNGNAELIAHAIEKGNLKELI